MSDAGRGARADDRPPAGGPPVRPDGGSVTRRRGPRGSPGITFSTRELRDLAAAWVALGVAFTFFLNPEIATALRGSDLDQSALLASFGLSLATVGVGFLLHELAHKVVAVRFGQLAAFRADYGMLFLAVMAGFAGFFFAAPGAVYHRGRITERENGLISVAGPVTNLALAAVFLPLLLFGGGVLRDAGSMGVSINLLLAGFNMLPYGPLDGRKVLAWSKAVWALVGLPSLALAAYALVGIGL